MCLVVLFYKSLISIISQQTWTASNLSLPELISPLHSPVKYLCHFSCTHTDYIELSKVSLQGEHPPLFLQWKYQNHFHFINSNTNDLGHWWWKAVTQTPPSTPDLTYADGVEGGVVAANVIYEWPMGLTISIVFYGLFHTWSYNSLYWYSFNDCRGGIV